MTMTNTRTQDTCQRISVLRATENDSIDIWEWRNDELTKKMSITTDSVSWETHSSWYEKSLVNPNRYLFLGYLNGDTKIGMCRFDVDVNTNIAEVSINLNPQQRSKKLSYQLLSQSIAKFCEEQNIDLAATIKKSNIGSIKCFIKSGFTFEREHNGYNFYRKKANKLSFKFIANACGIFVGKNGTKILCDPWLVDGVFDGSWCHFPKLTTSVNDVKNIDAIYISHLHPDHFDERHFDFEKSIPLIVLDHGPNFLIKKLTSLGYTNLIKIKNEETIDYKEFKLTMFSPFAKHNFHDATVGNLIDSALLISCDDVSALNANDNTPTIESASMLGEKYGPITLAMLNYNAAGPYPSCFDNLTEAEKITENNRVLERNLNHVKNVIQAMKPTYMLPFAGAYVLGGDLHFKNKYLGTATWDECAKWLKNKNIEPTKVVLLRENDTLNIEEGTSDNKYEPINLIEMKRYIEEDLSQLKYPHQLQSTPNKTQLIVDIEKAAQVMSERMGRFGISSTFSVVLNVFLERYQVYPTFKHLRIDEEVGDKLECKLDERLLRNILDRKSHWNNAEIGAHVSFNRTPNKYEPDLHTGLQFFHI
jgi:UDP-MurNAc hydroxylase